MGYFDWLLKDDNAFSGNPDALPAPYQQEKFSEEQLALKERAMLGEKAAQDALAAQNAPKLPESPEEEVDLSKMDLPTPVPAAPSVTRAAAPMPTVPAAPERTPATAEAAPMDPTVKDYLLKKYFSDKYSDEARQKLLDENKEDASGPNWSAALSALGTGLAGGNAAAAGEAVKARQAAERKGKLDTFDQGRAQELEKYQRDRMLTKDERDDAAFKRLTDPNSPESKVYQETLKEMGYKGDVSGLTAERIKEVSPVVSKMAELRMKKLEAAREQSNKDRDFGLKMATAKGELGKKSTEEKKMISYVTEGLRSINGMRDALGKGENTFSMVGDNDFTRSLRQMAENYGRMQSGGAINKDEEKRFEAMAPTWKDSKEQKLKKLDAMDKMFRERAQLYGADLEKAGIGPSSPQSDTKVVGGKTYRKVPGGWEEVE